MTSQRWSDSLKALTKLGLLVRLEKTRKCTKSTHCGNPTSYPLRDEISAVRNVIDKQKQTAERLHIIGMLSTQEYNKHNKNKCSVACTKCPTHQQPVCIGDVINKDIMSGKSIKYVTSLFYSTMKKSERYGCALGA